MTVWLVVGVVGAGSFLFRISMLVLAARVGLPAVLERAAGFAVPVAFAVLAVTSLAAGVTSDLASLAPLVAVAAAAVAVHRSGSRHAALLVGMPTLWVLTAFLPS
jgi:branched-subunit amino acid transport protein